MKTYPHCRSALLPLAIAVVSGINTLPAIAQETPPDILAIQIRSQGFACEKPLSAARDPKLSRPDQAVWTLKCKDISYRVHLNPGMAARVQRLP